MPGPSFDPRLDGFNRPLPWRLTGSEAARTHELVDTTRRSLSGDLRRLFYEAVEAYRVEEYLLRWTARTAYDLGDLQAGQVYAALDYFHARQFPPQLPDDPYRTLEGARFRRYLWQRQQDNLVANLYPWLASLAIFGRLPEEWFPAEVISGSISGEIKRLRAFQELEVVLDLGLAPGGLGWLHQQTAACLARLEPVVVSGRPWPVRLVCVPSPLQANRQVIAYQMALAGRGVQTVWYYDPQRPRQAQALEITCREGRYRIVTDRTPEGEPPVVGLLFERYLPAEPPARSWGGLRRLAWRWQHWLQGWRSPGVG